MVTSCFDFFPLLPCELRLHVWELAIRPPGAGVHRISIVDDDSQAATQGTLRAVPGDDDDFRGKKSRRRHIAAVAPAAAELESEEWIRDNSSASLWDAGLWTACRESRQVMMWHFRLPFWHDARHKLLQTGGYWSPAAVAEEFQDMTAMTVARNGRYFVVQPHRDLFWIEPQDWKSTVNWRTLFADLPFSSSLRGYGHLSHLAVEFDPSWNVDMPKDLPALLQESTPRGFVARAMAECATNRLYSFIWLIDRHLIRAANANRPEVEASDQPVTFYDCHHVYVETEREDLDDFRYGSDFEYEKTAVYFMQRLGTIGNGDYTLMADDSGDVDGFDFQVDDYLGVLSYV
ncbi:hypothetical protein XA68_16609 [Ophiocordyceps unilateralis]|uniref:2EXR domain-containing protein n=1 Tax=Ophiocordyceps unilateralis TaxID=268505 RepID=A0A2A9P4K7_OPHUN|nr:hypothetical protein XA68_16609 [Ophiocordyceps unilateralis]